MVDEEVERVELIRPDGITAPLRLSGTRTYVSVHRGRPETDPLRYRTRVRLKPGADVSEP